MGLLCFDMGCGFAAGYAQGHKHNHEMDLTDEMAVHKLVELAFKVQHAAANDQVRGPLIKKSSFVLCIQSLNSRQYHWIKRAAFGCL